MAEEIKLVGVFKDEITPKLKKLNREINTVTKSFAKMGKKLRPLAKEFGKLAASVDRVGDNLHRQNMELGEASRAMSKYRTQVRRTASEQKKLKAMRMGGGGGGARARGGGGGGGGGVRGISMGGMIGANIAGRMISDAIYRGFQAGVQLMMAPFKMLGASIKDGIEDEMSDIQSAGGMFALDKKSKKDERIFANFIQARNFQEELNRELAMSAASLPGATSDYVQSAKQLTDTVFGTYGKDKEGFAELAKSLGGKENATNKDDITTVLKKFTEQSVLLSQGSKGGMPLGMLLEQLISQDTVNIKTYKKRYKQLRSNPLLANMLEDAQADINAAGAMTSERFSAVMKALDNALPQEVVNSMRRSVAGTVESIRSGLFDQEVGLLGLRRPLEKSIAAINEFGQYVNADGVAVASAAEAAREQTTVFKMFRDIIAGFGLPMSEIVGILPEVFDPLEGMADALENLRTASIQFAQNANKYTNFFKQEGFDKAGARGSLAAINKLLSDMGALGEGDAMANAMKLESKDFNPASMVVSMMTSLLNSDFMGDIGNAIGGVIGSMFKVIDQMINGVVDTMEGEGGNKFIDGIEQGFKDAFGSGSFTKTLAKAFNYVAQILTKALVDVVLPALVDSIVGVIQGAWDAGAGGRFIAISAAIAALLLVINLAIGAFTGLVAIIGVIGSVIGFVSGIFSFLAPIISLVASVFQYIISGALVPFIAIIAAVAGVVMIGIAIFRNWNDIVKMAGAVLEYTIGALQQALGGLIGALGNMIGWIPGMGGTADYLKDAGQSMTDGGKAKTDAAAIKIGEAANGIAAQTSKDIAAINKSIGLGQGPAEVPATVKLASAAETGRTGTGRSAAKRAAEVTPAPQGLIGPPAPIAPAPPQGLIGPPAPEMAAQAAAIQQNAAENAKTPIAIEKNIAKVTETNTKLDTANQTRTAESLVTQGKIDQMVTAVTTAKPMQPVQIMASVPITIANLPTGFAAASGMPALGDAGSHSANALGPRNPAFFQTQAGAEAWEKKMAPKNAAISSMTANSSEFGGGNNIVNNINVTGGGSASETAEQVAQEIVYAIQKSTYNELYTS